MKRFIICIILVAALLVLACGCYFYTQSVTEDVEQRLNEIKTAYENDDRSRLSLLSAETADKWRGYCACRVFIADCDQALEIAAAIDRMSAMIENGDDGFITECAAAISLTVSYRESQSLKLCNIF